jgi:hypothetical protein
MSLPLTSCILPRLARPLSIHRKHVSSQNFTKKKSQKRKKSQKNRCNEIPICSSFPYLSISFIIALTIWFSAKCSAILHARVTLTAKMHGCLQILHHWNFHFNVCHVPYIYVSSEYLTKMRFQDLKLTSHEIEKNFILLDISKFCF